VLDVSPSAPRIGARDLECLLVLVEELHFARAAKRLGITQSALARTIRTLEAELGVPLVTRRSQTITLTEAGRRFAEHARPVLGDLRLATAEARRADDPTAPLRIGCVPDLRLQHLLGFLGAIHHQQPLVDVDLAYLRTSEQVQRLQIGELELALIHFASEAERIDIEPVYKGERLAAFLPLGHPAAGAEAVAPGDLGDDVRVMTPRKADPLDDHVTAKLTAAGHSFREQRETSGIDARSLVFAVAEHRCVAIAPTSTVELLGDIASLVTVRPLDPAVRMPDTALAWRAEPLPQLNEIVASARDVASAIYAQQST
jgi:DNA-binding transcriptional LysR family regulator